MATVLAIVTMATAVAKYQLWYHVNYGGHCDHVAMSAAVAVSMFSPCVCVYSFVFCPDPAAGGGQVCAGLVPMGVRLGEFPDQRGAHTQRRRRLGYLQSQA